MRQKYFYIIYNLNEEYLAEFDKSEKVAEYIGMERGSLLSLFCKRNSDIIKTRKYIVYR